MTLCDREADEGSVNFAKLGQINSESLWRNKGVFWLLVSEASVHGHLTPSLWASGSIVYHGGSTWWGRTSSTAAKKQNYRQERAAMPILLSKTDS